MSYLKICNLTDSQSLALLIGESLALKVYIYPEVIIIYSYTRVLFVYYKFILHTYIHAT